MEEKLKILIVNDNVTERGEVYRSLQAISEPVEVSEVADGAAAIAALQQQTFDCVFLDYRLPDGDALAVVGQIRSAGIEVPLIVLTGEAEESIAAGVIRAGASDYISKAKVSSESLVRSMSNAVRIDRAQKETAIARERVKDSEERYRLVLEGSNDGIWDWDIIQNEIYWNDRLLEIIGLPASGESGRWGAEFHGIWEAFCQRLHPEDRQKVNDAIAAHLCHKTEFNLEFCLRHSSGDYRYYMTRGKARRDAFGRPIRMAGIISDITGTKQAEQELRRRFEQLQIVYQITEAATRAVAVEEIYQAALNGLQTAIKADRSSVLLFDRSGVMRFKAWCGLSETYRQAVEGHSPWLPFTKNSQPICISDLEAASDFGLEIQNLKSTILAEGIRAVAFIPLVYQEKLMGKFMLYYNQPHQFTEGEIQLAQTIASNVAFATERKRSEDSQRFLADASNVLSLSLDYQTTLENLAGLAVPQIADWCAIDMVESDRPGGANAPLLRRVATARTNAVTGEEGHFVETKAIASGVRESASIAPTDRSPTLGDRYSALRTKVLSTGQAEFYPTYNASEVLIGERESPAVGEENPTNDPSPQSLICVPLVARGRSLGVMTLVLTSWRRYDRADLELAEDLARRAGLAVDNARLYQESRDAGENLRRAILILGEQQQQLRTLQRLTNLLNQRLANLPDLLQVMVQSVYDAIPGAQFCLIVLFNPQCDRLVLTVTAGMGTERLRMEDALSGDGQGWLNQVVSSGTYQSFREGGSDLPASVCAVAIESSEGGRMGALVVGNWEDSEAFDSEDRYLLVAVAEQAAIAINNARTIKTLEEREDRLAHQNQTLAQQNLELENQRQQIQLQNLQLLEAARLKSQFLATMSHELRTPMNAIIGFSQLLLRQRSRPKDSDLQRSLTADQENMVERILNNGKHLLTLIDDILDLSKIDAGRMELEREEFNLATLVSNAVAEFYSSAKEKHLTLLFSTRLSNPWVYNDSARLRQILVNLLSNAIKFTYLGEIQVEVGELSEDRLVLTVTDTGIGIAQENLEQIFEEFRQVDQSISKRHYGTGLGLAIVKLLVQLMDGKITVKSHLGEGSSFQVEFPRKLPPLNNQSQKKTTRRVLR